MANNVKRYELGNKVRVQEDLCWERLIFGVIDGTDDNDIVVGCISRAFGTTEWYGSCSAEHREGCQRAFPWVHWD